MYCKNCGQQIADNSRFCSYCGTLQKLPQTSANPQQVVNPQTVQKLEGVFGINISKQVLGIYLIWFLLHLILLLTNWGARKSANDYFFPFSKGDPEYYDLTEFLLYTVVPLIILVIVNLLRQPKEIQLQNLQNKYDLTYERDADPTIVGSAILLLSLIVLFANSSKEHDYDMETANQTRAIFSFISLILRIGITVWVVNISKKLNRDMTGWGIFAFFLPSIALIVIGQMRKLKNIRPSDS